MNEDNLPEAPPGAPPWAEMRYVDGVPYQIQRRYGSAPKAEPSEFEARYFATDFGKKPSESVTVILDSDRRVIAYYRTPTGHLRKRNAWDSALMVHLTVVGFLAAISNETI